jgi:hypothetical protein
MNDAQRALLTRILQSRHFVNAESLKRTLQYICEHASGPEDAQPKELEIATEALGRPGSFDPRTDPIVRVNVASIRERLESFFENEGRREALRLEIPRGRYRAVFSEAGPEQRFREGEDRRGPALERLWQPHLRGGADTVLVFSDLLFLRNAEGNFVRNIYVNDLSTGLADLGGRFEGLDLQHYQPSYHFVSAGEVEGILALSRMFHAAQASLEVKKTRFSSWNSLRQSNLILLGGSRTNSFLDALQGDEDPFVILADHIENRSPVGGEEASWSRVKRREGKLEKVIEHAVFTRRPGLAPGTAVSIIAANHGRAIEGACDFLTKEREVDGMLGWMDLAGAQPLPAHFQVVLKVDLVDFDEEVAEVVPVTHRTLPA